MCAFAMYDLDNVTITGYDVVSNRPKVASYAEIALKAAHTDGAIGAEVSLNTQGSGPAFATHVCDVAVDPETGHVKVLRYVERQIQGGVTQDIGWALSGE